MAAFPYFPQTDGDIRQMLDRIGVKSLDDLYSDVPDGFLYKGEYDLPDAMSEQQVRDFFEGMAARNPHLTVFAGAGAYDHYTPAVIPYITQRSEFLTAYTPYQCEISQGTLRYIFEYQSMICTLTGMDVSNASMYDGPTAAAEAMRMAVSCAKKKNTVLLSDTLFPHVRNVVGTYARYYGVKIEMIDQKDGQTSLESLKALMEGGDVAGVIVPSVNRFGIVEDLTGFGETVHAAKALFVQYCDPSALAVVKTPAEWGADVAVGDGQPLGIPLCYGGPYVGFMACRKDYMRKLPGRIVGETRDAAGRRSFVLTLQAREQHIRREKATSNICSNESLMALWVTVYLSLMGSQGMRKVNEESYKGAHYLCDALLATGKFQKVFDAPFLKEFVLKPLVPVEQLQRKLYDAGIFGALETEDGFVSFCVTEKRTKAEIDRLVGIIKEC
ncbi:MAG: aminomethyl-transferring glycine dehydrogenase subunit GcvPA [Bacteroidaceae bacterium]|nr:aminomethyl-transferring glycine dehydrogenase subunit GcvPA [Bacteroidaceae bacterium]